MRANAWPSIGDMLAMSTDELANVDPVAANLVVAQGIPSLAGLDIGHYVQLADTWAAEIKRRIPAGDANFFRQPHLWQNDLNFARLALMCWYVGNVLRIRYREDQRSLRRVLYTDPGDLFLNGVMDSRQGTCGNMALLHVMLGRRIGLPVSLACVGSHFICRYDDGEKVYNIEATNHEDDGTFCSPPDEYYQREYQIPQRAIDCGSDLRAVNAREMLGLFLGLRARHLENTDRMSESEPDYLLARYLFPRNRQLYVSQNQVSVQFSMELFEPGEKGHPTELAAWLQQVVQIAPWERRSAASSMKPHPPQGKPNGSHQHSIFEPIIVSARSF